MSSSWYHVVCRHRRTKPPLVYVCDLEDDDGAGARTYDRVAEWQEYNGLPKGRRDFGLLLRVHNRAGLQDPPLATVTIVEDRHRGGHWWKLWCAVCEMTVDASDESLRAALRRLQPKISVQQGVEKLIDSGEVILTRVPSHVVVLGDLQNEVSNPSMS